MSIVSGQIDEATSLPLQHSSVSSQGKRDVPPQRRGTQRKVIQNKLLSFI